MKKYAMAGNDILSQDLIQKQIKWKIIFHQIKTLDIVFIHNNDGNYFYLLAIY
jgi:hypothetical protein